MRPEALAGLQRWRLMVASAAQTSHDTNTTRLARAGTAPQTLFFSAATGHAFTTAFGPPTEANKAAGGQAFGIVDASVGLTVEGFKNKTARDSSGRGIVRRYFLPSDDDRVLIQNISDTKRATDFTQINKQPLGFGETYY